MNAIIAAIISLLCTIGFSTTACVKTASPSETQLTSVTTQSSRDTQMNEDNEPTDGDGIDCDPPGTKSADLLTSPDGLWRVYDVEMDPSPLGDCVIGMYIEGPHGVKKLLATGKPLEWSFSPDSKLFLYVSQGSKPDPDGEQSTYVYHVESGKTDEFPKMEPGKDGVEWDGHIAKFDSRGDSGFEHVTINIDTKEMARNPFESEN